MTRFPGVLRAKLAVADYGRQIVAVLVVLGVLSLGGAAWIYAHPPTTTVTDSEHVQTIESTLHTSASVTGESNLYRRGTRLRDQSIYLLPAAPNLTLTVSTTAPSDEDVRLLHRLELVTRASNDGSTFWQRSTVLAERRATASSGSMNTSATVDVPGLRNRLEPIAGEIGAGSSLDVFVRVTTSYETNRYSGTLRDTTPLEVSGGSYSIDPLALETTESTPRTRRIVLPSRDPLAYLSPAAAGAVALLLAGVVGFNYRRLPEPERLADRVQRSRYAEWVSAGALPTSLDGQRVEVESLEDLVGVAIDTKKRVLFDRDRDVYAVVDGRMIYCYGDSDWQGDGGFVWPTERD